ncbi:MAG: DMT family transporter [Kiloniellaceae bacterium]
MNSLPPAAESHLRPLHMLLILGIMLLWGINFAVAKIGLEQLPPIFLVASRFLLVAVLLLPFAKRPEGQWGAIVAIAFTLGLLHFSFMFNGLKTVDAATAAIAIQLQVPFASLLAALFFKDKLGWRRALGMAIAFFGVAVVAGEPRLGGQYLALGLIITASFIWSIANVQIKQLNPIDGISLNAWVAVFATPLLFGASLVLEDGQWEAVQQADFWAYFAVVYQAVAVVVIGYGFWYWLMRRYQINQIMPATLLVPPIGVLSGVMFLGESLTLNLIAGGLMTVVGVAIIIIRRPKTTAPEAERL